MKFNEMILEIGTKVDKSLGSIKNLINSMSNLKSSTTGVSNAMKKVSESTSPAINKINELSTASKKAGQDLSKNLNTKTNVDIGGSTNNINALQKQLSYLIDTYNEHLSIYRQWGDLATTNTNKVSNSTKLYGQELVKAFGTPITIDSLTKEKQNIDALIEKINSVKDKKVVIIVNTEDKDLDSTDDKIEINAKKFQKLRKTILGIGAVFSKLKGIVGKFTGLFGKVGNNLSNTSDTLLHKLKKLSLGLLAVRTTMSLLTRSVNAYLAFDSMLQDSVSNSWNMLGSLLAPAIQLVANLFATATAYIYTFVKALTGIDLVARANAKALNAQAKATGAASKAQRSLSPMDEITNLQDDSSGGGGGGGEIPQITVPDIEPSEIFSKLIDAIKAGDWYGVGQIIAEGINTALGSIDWGKIQKTAVKIGINFANLLNGIVDNLDWHLLGYSLGNVIQLGISFAYGLVTTFHWATFGKGLGDLLNGAFEGIDWKMLGQTIYNGIIGILDTAINFLDTVKWEKIGEDIATAFAEIDWGTIIKKLFEAIGKAFEGFDEFLTGLLGGKAQAGFAEGLILALGGITLAFKTFFSVIDKAEKLQKFIDKVQTAGPLLSRFKSGVLDGAKALGKFIVNIAKTTAELIKMIAQQVISIGKLILQKAATAAMTIAQGALNLVMSLNPIALIVIAIAAVIAGLVLLYNKCEGFRNFINGVFQTIIDVVTGVIDFFKNNWQGILLFIMNPFAGAFKLLYDNFEGFRNFVDGVVKNIKDFFSGLVEGIKNVFKGIKEWFGNVFSGIYNAITKAFSKAVSFFTNIKNKILNVFKMIGTKVGSVISGAFKGVVNGVLGAIEKILNTPIKAINGLIKVINKVPGINLGKLNTFNLPRLATGTNNIEAEGIYHLHEGEAVVPKKYNPATGGYNDGSDNRQIIDLLIDLNANMLALSEREMAIYMDTRKVAEGIYGDMQTITKNKNMSGVMKRS